MREVGRCELILLFIKEAWYNLGLRIKVPQDAETSLWLITSCKGANDMTQYITLPKQAIDITDQKFGRLTALGPIGYNKNQGVVWLCRCECGNVKEIHSGNLRSGVTKSCGCWMRELVGLRFATHGNTAHPLYGTWVKMIDRCDNPKVKHYANYGGRGIFVCDEWHSSFDVFCEYVSSLLNYGMSGYSLDRIDNDGNYEPCNVRWATDMEQARNSRHAHLIEFCGKIQCVTAWSEETGIPRGTLNSRLFQGGWSIERALTTPARKNRSA